MTINRIARFSVLISVSLFLCNACAVDLGNEAASSDEPIGDATEGLFATSGTRFWTENGNVVPVCYETAGLFNDRQILQSALRATWMRYANVRFTGFGQCPNAGFERFVRVNLHRPPPPECTQPGDPCNGAGGSVRSGSLGMAGFHTWMDGWTMDLSIGPNAPQSRREYLAVHEFGHVLGFSHEQDRNDNSDPADAVCNPNGGIDGSYITPYDRQSIMHYCGSHGNGSGVLSTRDKQGVIAIHGPSPKLFAESTSSRIRIDYNGDGRSDTSWYEPNTNEFVIRFSNGGGWQERRKDTSGWGNWSGAKHFSRGDFNGDGKTDWSWYAPWTNTFVVMLSNGQGSWQEVHTNTAGWGNWSEGKHFRVGDFNADNRDDWSWYAPWSNDMIVMLSNGAGGFTPVGNWTGGWGDISNVSFFSVGDYNGDNRDDWSMYAPWSNHFLVLLSAGNGHWAAEYYNDTSAWGNWSDGYFFRVGDYNGDGRDDWSWHKWRWYAPADNKLVVMLSNGAGGFTTVQTDTNRWGVWTAAKFFSVGDYNGDNRDDWSWYAPWLGNIFIVMLSNGAGGFTEVRTSTSGWGDWAGGAPFVVGDYNGDNRDDWAWYASWSNNWHVMMSNTAGGWASVATSEY